MPAQAVESQGLGRALKLARIAAGLGQGAVANRLGVHETTVSAWERGRQRPGDEVLAELAEMYNTTIGAFYQRSGAGSSPDFSTETRAPSVALGLPKDVRVWMQEFLLELARADVSDREIDEARRVLTSPENYTFYAGGEAKDYTEDEMIMGLEAFALVIRDVLRKRGYKLKAK